MRNRTRNRILAMAASAAIIGDFNAITKAASLTWTSTFDQSWSNPANWSGGTVPGISDVALFSASFQPASKTVNLSAPVSLGALVDNMSSTSSLTIGGSGAITLSGQTVSVPQVGGTFSSANVVISATSTASNATKNLTLGPGINLILSHAQNVIVGTQGATSGGSGQGNVITISGNISDGPSVNAGITFLGNGNFGNEGAALSLTGNNTFSGGLVIGAANGLNGGQLRVTSNSNLGTGSIVVNDQAQLIFNGAAIYGNTGQVLVVNGTGLLNNTGSSGAIRTGANTVWAGDIVIGSSLPLDGTNGYVVLSATGVNTLELRGTYSGSGNLQKQGGGTMLMTGPNTGTGATQIGNGVITVMPGSAISNGDLIMLQSSMNTGVALNLFNTLQNVGNLSSSFTQTSGSYVQFINLGTLNAGSGPQLNIKQTSNKSFGFGAASGLTSTVQGPGSVTLDAASTAALTLTGPNVYTGGSVINGGTLTVANGTGGSATGTGTVTVNSGGNLSSGQATVFNLPVNAGVISGPVVANSGGNVYPGGNNSIGTITVGGLVSHTGSSLNFDLIGGTSASADRIVDTGSLSFDSLASVKLYGSKLAVGSYSLISFSGGSLSGGGGTFLPSVNPGGVGRTYLLTLDSSGLTLNITSIAVERFWSVGGTNPVTDGGGSWSAGGTTFFNTNPDTTSAPFVNAANDDVIIGNGGAGGIITLGGAVRAGGPLVFGATSNPAGYSINSGGSLTSLQVAGGIVGSNNATINAPVILEGSQSFSSDAGHTITIAGNISETGGAARLSKDDSGTISLTGTNVYTGGTSVNSGTLKVTTAALPVTGGVTNNATLMFSQANDGTYSGTISGAGSVVVNNPSPATVVALTGSSNYSGPTVLQSGVLAVASPSNLGTGAGGIKLAGGTLRASGDLTLPSSFGAANLVVDTSSTIDTNGRTVTLNNILNGGGNLTKTGAGSLVVSGIHTTDVLGELAISAGTVSIAPGSTVSYGFAISPTGGTWVGDLVLATPVELRLQGGMISGGGTIRVKPSTVLMISRGATTISNNIILNDNAVPIPGFTANLGADTAHTLFITGAIQGQADVDFTGGAGTVYLSGANSYTGKTTIDNDAGGAVLLAVDNSLPTGTAVHVTSTGVFDLNGHNQTIAAIDAGTVSATLVNGIESPNFPSNLTIIGSASTEFDGYVIDGNYSSLRLTLGTGNTGNLILTNELNNYTGGTTLNAGTLTVGLDANLGDTSSTLNFGGGTLAATASFDMATRAVIVNPGNSGLAPGAGVTLGLTGSAPLKWLGGTLNVSGGGTVSLARTGLVTVSSASTFNINAGNTAVVNATVDPFTDASVNTRHVSIVNNGALSITAGNSVVARHTGSGSLSLSNGATLKLAANASSVTSSSGTLSVGTLSGSKLDITNNAMVINGNTLASVGTLIVSGYNGGGWDGAGLTSSSIATAVGPKTEIGYGLAGTLGVGSFGGIPVIPSSVLVKYTYAGDSNLDGKVDAVDLGNLAAHWQSTSGIWTGGDFNYDGTVDIRDLYMLAINWKVGVGAPLDAPLGSVLASFGLPPISVPEPASASIFIGAGVLLARRRRTR